MRVKPRLHIISFNIPYPPNYGGIIDVFYRIETLWEMGCDIILHCFEYGRERPEELQRYCREIHYYPRRAFLPSFIGSLPYIVSSRASVQLLDNLLKDQAPIFFDGLHCCYYINDPQLTDRLKIVRMHNVEWEYYKELARVERSYYKEMFFSIESFRLKRYEKILSHADFILTVTPDDTAYFSDRFSAVLYIPSFHDNQRVDILEGRGTYTLYHGNLSVPENIYAASFLVGQVFSDLDIPLIIAGLDPDTKIYELAEGKDNIEIIANPSYGKMEQLIREAHVNMLPTFQHTGLKLKMINTLFKGRFCIANSAMVAGTPMESLCIIADTVDEMRSAMQSCFTKDFPASEIIRRSIMEREYNNKLSGERIMQLLYSQSLR